MNEITEKIESKQLFRKSSNDSSLAMFNTAGSAGRNNQKLAQICHVWDFTMNLLGWQNKPLANLTTFLTQYQASVDAKYHNDYKDVLVAEEIESKRAERKGLSLMVGK